MRRVVRPSLILIAVLLAGCLDRIFGPRKKKADYAIDCEPALVTLPRGSAGTVSCTVTSKNGFANEVGLSASNLPAGVTMVFGSASVKPPKNGSTTVWAQVAIGNSVNPSTNPWTVVGSSGGTTHSWNGSLGVVEKTATVHLVYLVPSDRQQRDDFARRMEGAIRHAQIWYLNTLGNGKTFAISHPSVAIYKTPHPASWYSTNNPGDASVFRFSNNVQADGLPLAGARVDDPDNVWVLYIDAPAGAGQAPGSGGRGIAVIDGTWLARLGQKDAAGNCPADRAPVLVIGHGHAAFNADPHALRGLRGVRREEALQKRHSESPGYMDQMLIRNEGRPGYTQPAIPPTRRDIH